MSATTPNTWIPTLTLLQAVSTVLREMLMESGKAVFERVEIFESPDLTEALGELHLLKDRICLVCPSADEFTNQPVGRGMDTTCEREVILLMATRFVGDKTRALTASEGILAMKDRVLEVLPGSNLNFGPRLVRAQVTGGSPFQLTLAEEKKAPARQCWELDIKLNAGDRHIPYN